MSNGTFEVSSTSFCGLQPIENMFNSYRRVCGPNTISHIIHDVWSIHLINSFDTIFGHIQIYNVKIYKLVNCQIYILIVSMYGLSTQYKMVNSLK